jgi:hypothetical protein
MNTMFLLDRPAISACKVLELTKAGYHLNVALVYQDSTTRHCAVEVRDLIAERSGQGVVRSTEWLISNLVQPSVFTLGIQALAKADAIVIAVRETDRFPGAFYMWVNLWLQVRSGKVGALVALVETSTEESAEFMETRRYLHAVASQGGLELILKECEPTELPWNLEPHDLKLLARTA